MLLARVDDDTTTTATPLRGVFARNDAWLATGDLFRRDVDNDLWLVDDVADLVPTEHGRVPTIPVVDALMTIPGVDLAIAYGIATKTPSVRDLTAAVTLLEGTVLDADAVTDALRGLDPQRRPTVVRVVDDIPTSTWYRPLKGPLREVGIPAPTEINPVFRINAKRDRYRAVATKSPPTD